MISSINIKAKSFVSLGIREMNSLEYLAYCQYNNLTNQTNSQNLKVLTNFVTQFTQEFGMRVFTANCFYYNVSTGAWYNDLNVTANSGIAFTECLTWHLTDFAGGFVELVPAIDFDNVWANGWLSYKKIFLLQKISPFKNFN